MITRLPRSRRRMALVSVLLVVSGLLITTPALAQTPAPTDAEETAGEVPQAGGWSVDPGGSDAGGSRSAFVYTLRPGQVFQDTVAVTNTTDAPKTFLIYATDAFNTPIDAGFALLLGEEEPVDVGTWVTAATNQITVEPNTRVEIPFQVAVPLDAEPATTSAASSPRTSSSTSASEQGDVGFEIRRRVAARVYVRVDGPLTPELHVERIHIDHENPPCRRSRPGRGDRHLRDPQHRQRAPHADRRRARHRPARPDRRQVGRPRTSPSSCRAARSSSPSRSPTSQRSSTSARGLRSAQADMASEIQTFKGSTGFWSISWGVVVLLVLVVVLGVIARRNRRRQQRAAAPRSSRPPGSSSTRDRSGAGGAGGVPGRRGGSVGLGRPGAGTVGHRRPRSGGYWRSGAG